MIERKKLLVLPSIPCIEEIINGMPIELTKGKYSKLEFRFKNGEILIAHSGIDIKTFSNVWLSSFWGSRDLAYAVRLYLEHFNTPHTYVEEASSKVTDQMIFGLKNIRIPNTFFVDSNKILEFVEIIEEICGYPLIIKDIKGHKGKDSSLVNSREELINISTNQVKSKKYLFQTYIPNDYDWGILIANNKVVSGEKSYPKKGEFRNHACNGATEIFVKVDLIPEHIKKMAIEASSVLGLSWSRTDIIVDKNTGEAFLMEVNRSPGITSGSSEITAAKKFVKEILKQ